MSDEIEQQTEDVAADAQQQEEPNEKQPDYREKLVEQQAQQIAQLIEQNNSLMSQIGQLVKGGAQIRSAHAEAPEQPAFTTDPAQNVYYNPHKDVKPFSELNFV